MFNNANVSFQVDSRNSKPASKFMQWLVKEESTECYRGEEAEIAAALKRWQSATAFFESVTDPSLVDYAIYDMEAAQKRYVYLLRRAGSS